jgi:hypothetical protein
VIRCAFILIRPIMGVIRIHLIAFSRLGEMARPNSAGIGSNSDGLTWNPGYTSDNWNAAVGEAAGQQWVVEIEINAAAEMGAQICLA